MLNVNRSPNRFWTMWPFDKPKTDTTRKVFGLGLSKTGTSSLGVALERLGYTHLGYRRDLVKHWHAQRLGPVEKALDAHSAFEDWPIPSMAKYLMRRLGASAYYILTLRQTPEIWLEILKSHAIRSAPKNAQIRRLSYGKPYPQMDERHFLDFYQTHNEAVVHLAASLGLQHRLRLLCWKNGDGWPELAAFLGRDVPQETFPRANQGSTRPVNPITSQQT